MTAMEVRPVAGLGEVRAGADLAALLAPHVPDLADGDIVVVSSKIVSKAEGRVVRGSSRPDEVRRETVRVVASRGETQIVETRHGFVMAAAGVDASNVEAGNVVLLPLDPDESARRLRRGLTERLGVGVGVVVTDTFGRPWRLGQTDLAIGAAGVQVLDDHAGRVDRYGNELAVTAPALADEIAAAADLVKGKLTGVPAAIVRGHATLVTVADGPGVAALIRPPDQDLFRLGTYEAMRDAVSRVPTEDLAAAPPRPDTVRRALDLADLAVAPPAYVFMVDDATRKELLDAAGLPPTVPCVLAFATADAGLGAGLALGAARERLRRACAVEGLAAPWVPADRLPADPARRACAPYDPVGILAIGAPNQSRDHG